MLFSKVIKLTKCERRVVFKTCTTILSITLRLLITIHCIFVMVTYSNLLWLSKLAGYFTGTKQEYFVDIEQNQAWRANTFFTIFYALLIVIIAIQVQMDQFRPRRLPVDNWIHVFIRTKLSADTFNLTLQDQSQALVNVFNCNKNEKFAKCFKNRSVWCKHMCECMFATPAELYCRHLVLLTPLGHCCHAHQLRS